MASGNNCQHNETVVTTNYGSGHIIIIVLYILLAIILGSLFTY